MARYMKASEFVPTLNGNPDEEVIVVDEDGDKFDILEVSWDTEGSTWVFTIGLHEDTPEEEEPAAAPVEETATEEDVTEE